MGMNPARCRVILNDRAVRGPLTGVGHYVLELLRALPDVAPDIGVLPFYQTCLSRRRAVPVRASLAPGPPRRWPAWIRPVAHEAYHLAFDLAATLGRFSLYHEPNHIPAPWHGPILTTVHDLSVLRHPEWHPLDRVRWYERDFMASLPRSTHFITVSAFSRSEMVNLLGVGCGRISVIPLGVRAVFHPRPAADVRAWLTSEHLPPEYVLFAGTLEPRKNLPAVLDAYSRLPRGLRDRFPLLLAGMTGGRREELADRLRDNALENNVRVLGYVDDEALARLYCGARLLVWPSFYEGFGLPPLECMASGTPVIASSVTSIPEVVGDAGLLVDPHDPGAIGDALHRVLEDDGLAEDLSARGLERAKRFSWRTCAATHADLYRRFARKP